MLPLASYFGDSAQAVLAVIATSLMLVSLNAYRRRSEARYLLLGIAFVCLCAASVSALFLELVVGVGPGTIQMVELYLIPSLELLMALSFLVALVWSSGAKRRLRAIFGVAVVAVLGLALISAYTVGSGNVDNGKSVLPSGCVKPAGGYLIVASEMGYNDSVGHGAPAKSWPVLDTLEGSNVTITVCNTYQQPVGFQIAHYLQNKAETILPGQVLTLSFVADQEGTFSIYCQIFCLIHIYLQGGVLRVT